MSGVGRIRVRWHRAYQGKIKTCRIVRKAGRWYVSLMCEVSEPMPLPKTGRVIGIDMGINSLITTSDGEQVNNPRWYREAQAELRRKQRKLGRAQRGSNQRKKKLLDVQRQHEHVKNQRKDFFDKRVYELVLRSRSSLPVFAAQAQYFKQLGGGRYNPVWICAQLHSFRISMS